MKKILIPVLILALALQGAVPPAFGEDPSPAGTWYASLNGIPLTLTLEEDGSYRLEGAGKTAVGTWEAREGFLFQDGDESAPLSLRGDVLYREDLDLFFTREEPDIYVPAEVSTSAETGDFDGYWTAAYTENRGAVLPAEVTEEDTEVYIEGNTAALGGKLFMGAQMAFGLQNGSLVYADENMRLQLSFCLLQDGMLRLDITAAGDTLRIYLESRLPAGED